MEKAINALEEKVANASVANEAKLESTVNLMKSQFLLHKEELKSLEKKCESTKKVQASIETLEAELGSIKGNLVSRELLKEHERENAENLKKLQTASKSLEAKFESQMKLSDRKITDAEMSSKSLDAKLESNLKDVKAELKKIEVFKSENNDNVKKIQSKLESFDIKIVDQLKNFQTKKECLESLKATNLKLDSLQKTAINPSVLDNYARKSESSDAIKKLEVKINEHTKNLDAKLETLQKFDLSILENFSTKSESRQDIKIALESVEAKLESQVKSFKSEFLEMDAKVKSCEGKLDNHQKSMQKAFESSCYVKKDEMKKLNEDMKNLVANLDKAALNPTLLSNFVKKSELLEFRKELENKKEDQDRLIKSVSNSLENYAKKADNSEVSFEAKLAGLKYSLDAEAGAFRADFAKKLNGHDKKLEISLTKNLDLIKGVETKLTALQNSCKDTKSENSEAFKSMDSKISTLEAKFEKGVDEDDFKRLDQEVKAIVEKANSSQVKHLELQLSNLAKNYEVAIKDYGMRLESKLEDMKNIDHNTVDYFASFLFMKKNP